jgi:hypothetical protein
VTSGGNAFLEIATPPKKNCDTSNVKNKDESLDKNELHNFKFLLVMAVSLFIVHTKKSDDSLTFCRKR